MLSNNISSAKGYSWWDQSIYDTLGSTGAKKAYRLAAELHDGIQRKDGTHYLTHINGSLKKLERYAKFIGTKFDIAGLQKMICIHDCIEDHKDGIKHIEAEFGIDTLIMTLWMSIPKECVRDGLPKLIARKPQYKAKLDYFLTIYQTVWVGDLTNEDVHNSLTVVLPWQWHNTASMYRDAYMRESHPEKKKDIFAKFIFQGMVKNMPEYVFLVKCIERLDNLMSRDGLKNEKWEQSYTMTAKTTKEIYCPRLRHLGYSDFADLLEIVSQMGINDIRDSIKISTSNILSQSPTTSI